MTKLMICTPALFLLAVLTVVSTAQSTILKSFGTCPTFFDYMVRNSAKRVDSWGRRSPFHCIRPFDGPFRDPRLVSEPVLATTTSSDQPSARPPPVEGVDFSGTNNQVSGVDEPDIVKTDGERVFTISNRKFFYVKTTKSGMGGKVVATLSIPHTPQEMLFDSKSNSIVVISQQNQQIFSPIVFPRDRFFRPSCRTYPVIFLYRISVENDQDVKITDVARIPGRYISARSVEDVAHLVFSYDPAGIDILRPTKLRDWLPSYTASGEYCIGNICEPYKIENPIADCGSIYYPDGVFSGFSLLTVATFNLRGKFILRGSAVAADGDTVYANTKSMYVATNQYRFDLDESDGNIGRGFVTSFHKFELSFYKARYVASGDVQGSVLNQFSMHEYKGTFFVATTIGASWWRNWNPSFSKVTSFRQKSTKLVKAGEVSGLGKGERIYAVRYIADVAYIVTFRQIDPLYIVDLSDVHNMKVTGELKIPGYSAYLHPISPGRILGVGRDATPEGRTTGAKVSLFDVSNAKSPIELTSWTLKGSYTTAEWEHKAFLWWGPEKIAVLPLSVYYRDTRERFVGSIVLDVSDQYISERGRISHKCCGASSVKTILRNFVISSTNLWSLSRNALQVNGIKHLEVKSFIELKSTPTPTPWRFQPGPVEPISVDVVDIGA